MAQGWVPSMSTPSEELLARLRAMHEKGTIKRQIVHVEEWLNGRRTIRPHLLAGGKLVRLTDAEIFGAQPHVAGERAGPAHRCRRRPVTTSPTKAPRRSQPRSLRPKP
jgi:hypothetical protein